ncbi:hypothetical protein BGZ97_011570 [Linnemannia gamsii]|uniref:Uncharacterized protein n=1 Tax=Linnemannia gamsii TaxID=64522 RepID=A0A9P6R8A9_9FUNG|nr:hypothetical protein BGZ97_011570 [Linnemannia gamsii]
MALPTLMSPLFKEPNANDDDGAHDGGDEDEDEDGERRERQRMSSLYLSELTSEASRFQELTCLADSSILCNFKGPTYPERISPGAGFNR